MRKPCLYATLALLLMLTACSPAPANPTPVPSALPSVPVEDAPPVSSEPASPSEPPSWEDRTYTMDFTAGDETILLSVSYTLPYLSNSGDYPPWQAVNAYYDRVEADLIASAEEHAEQARSDYELTAQSGLSYQVGSEEMDYTIVRQTGRYVSLTREFYVTAEGAAHPSVFLWSEQLDLTTGKLVRFADCFTDPNTAAQRVLDAVLATQEAAELQEAGISAGKLTAALQPEHFYLTDQGFVFWYQSEELGTNHSPIEIPVSYESFDGILQNWVSE